MTAVLRITAVQTVRWGARLWATVLFLFWGAFFVEHTAEWFGRGTPTPPLDVVALHTLHGLFLLGLIVGWRWELAGGLLALVTGVSFFLQAAGTNGPLFSLVSIVPAVAWIGLALYPQRGQATLEVAGGKTR